MRHIITHHTFICNFLNHTMLFMVIMPFYIINKTTMVMWFQSLRHKIPPFFKVFYNLSILNLAIMQKIALNKAINTLINNGLNTIHHDQVIKPNIFAITKIINNAFNIVILLSSKIAYRKSESFELASYSYLIIII